MTPNPWVAKAANDIGAKAASLGLRPISAMTELSLFSFVQSFTNGFDIYWSLAGSAREVHGEIKRKYDLWGGGNGFLGLPQTDETEAPDGIGRYNHFDNGSIYWTDHTGPMTVSGPIRSAWAALGWERGPLGYPITDQVRWRSPDPATDPLVVWNLFENGAIVTNEGYSSTPSVPGEVGRDYASGTAQALAVGIAPDQLRYLVHRAVDTAVHQLQGRFGLYPDIETTGVFGYEADFIRSKSRAITFKLHGFQDNGIFKDNEFHFWFALRFNFSIDSWSFSDPERRRLQLDLLPDSVGNDADGISGWFENGNDYKQRIENAFNQLSANAHGANKGFYAMSNFPPRIVWIIDILTTASGGIDFLVNPDSIDTGNLKVDIEHFVWDF
jgi:hypothetical protein